MRSAIYARQSVDKKDSISIESQIDDCRNIAGDNPYIFSDKGFSGANLQRPSFTEMMECVENGEIDRIIIYRLDRISRSLPDFVNLTEKLRKHNVTLCSKSEGFDTSSETSLILLNILMMFAQMERGAISQRVRDNYYSRAKKGLYLGGSAPFGYDKVPLTIGNIHTSYLVENSDSEIVLEIYERYACSATYTSIAATLNDRQIKTSRGNYWTAGAVRRILRNPVYVRADKAVYRYLEASGAEICTPYELFDGRRGCICFGSPRERAFAKYTTLRNESIVIGFHEGIIPPNLWLSAQKKNTSGNISRGQASFLQGLMKCGCGYSLYTKRYKDRKYLCCRGRKLHICSISHPITCDELELLLEPLICKRLEFLSQFEERRDDSANYELLQLERKYSRLMHILAQSSENEATIIERELDDIKGQLATLTAPIMVSKNSSLLDFTSLDFPHKKAVVRQLIERIEISKDSINLIWK